MELHILRKLKKLLTKNSTIMAKKSINKRIDNTSNKELADYESDFSYDLNNIDDKDDLLNVLDDTIEYEYTSKGRHIPRTLQVLIALVKNHL